MNAGSSLYTMLAVLVLASGGAMADSRKPDGPELVAYDTGAVLRHLKNKKEDGKVAETRQRPALKPTNSK